MKAYFVSDTESYEDYCTVVFAETRGKAKVEALGTDACEDAEYMNIRALRIPELDSFYRGLPEMDWFNEQDQIGMVRYANMYCTYEMSISECECEKCKAKEWCCRYESEVGDD